MPNHDWFINHNNVTVRPPAATEFFMEIQDFDQCSKCEMIHVKIAQTWLYGFLDGTETWIFEIDEPDCKPTIKHLAERYLAKSVERKQA